MSHAELDRAAQAERSALVHAPFALLSFDDDGVVHHANAQLHALLGYAPGELIGKPVDRLMTPATRVFHSTHFFPLLKLKNQVDEIHLSLRPQQGADVPVMVSAQRVVHDGRALNHCALMTIWQRKEFESALVEARRKAEAATAAKDEFLAMVSHELRTPLSAILGWVRLAQSGKLDASMQARALQTIERNAKAQGQLIEDLLDVSRIVSGKLRLSPRPVDLSPVVEAAADTARPSAQAKDITLLLALDRAAGIVYADPDRVQQIVWNLVSNAIKFTPKGGRVQVRLARVDSRVCIEVADTGPGLSATQLPYVFDRFWQNDRTTKREHSGLGLGLSICKSLVELHGGTIRADSPGLGEGAVFTVELPLAVAAPLPSRGGSTTAPSSAGDAGLDGLQLLVVDDDEDARGLMKMLLEGAGATVRLAASTEAALAALRQQVPDLLLSDVGMPGEDGYALIRRVRAGEVPDASSIAAVAVTGLARPQDRVALLRAGYQAHLCKPVEPAEVLALVQALARRGLPA